MDPEMRNLLLRIAENTEENNVLLRKMHRSMVWGRIFRIIYWLIIIGLAVGAFYFIQPYLETISNIVGFDFSNNGGDSNEGFNYLEFFKNFR